MTFELEIEFYLTEQQKKEWDMEEFIIYLESDKPYVTPQLLYEEYTMATEHHDALLQPFKLLTSRWLKFMD